MRVVLLEHTPNPERVCCASAKLCHEPDDRDFLVMYNSLTDEHIEKILKHVLKLGHESIIEHASFTFYVEGVSRALTHQLVRHRVASYSQQSQRYVKMKEPTYVAPRSPYLIAEQSEHSLAVFENCMSECWDTYKQLIEEGWRPEDARFVLPNACTTKIVVTMNVRELRHFFNLRCDEHAQWEIRKLAKEMLLFCYDISPILFDDLYEKFIIKELIEEE